MHWHLLVLQEAIVHTMFDTIMMLHQHHGSDDG